MKNLWGEAEGLLALEERPGPLIAARRDAAVKELEIEGRFAELERARLVAPRARVAGGRERAAAFEVDAVEEKRVLEFAGLEFAGRIDRMDKLADGGHALIDYKTGPQRHAEQLGAAAPRRSAAAALRGRGEGGDHRGRLRQGAPGRDALHGLSRDDEGSCPR